MSLYTICVVPNSHIVSWDSSIVSNLARVWWSLIEVLILKDCDHTMVGLLHEISCKNILEIPHKRGWYSNMGRRWWPYCEKMLQKYSPTSDDCLDSSYWASSKHSVPPCLGSQVWTWSRAEISAVVRIIGILPLGWRCFPDSFVWVWTCRRFICTWILQRSLTSSSCWSRWINPKLHL